MLDVVLLIKEHLAPALLVMARIGGLALYAPMFSSQIIPIRFKVMTSIVLGLAIYPLVAQTHEPHVTLTLTLWSMAPLVAAEIVIGVLIGYAASLPLVATQTAGMMMGQQMGLGFAQIYDPSVGDQSDIVGQILFYLSFATFLILGGHEAIIGCVLSSFNCVPLGAVHVDATMLDLVVGLLLAAFELALRVAAPLLAIIFLQSTAMGFIAKTVPQLNILSLGFPIRILVGMGLIASGMVVMNEVILEHVEDGFATIHEWLDLPSTRVVPTAG